MTKKHNIVVPKDLYDEFERIAAEHGLTAAEVVRTILRVGLLAFYVDGKPDAELIIREGDEERVIQLVEGVKP